MDGAYASPITDTFREVFVLRLRLLGSAYFLVVVVVRVFLPKFYSSCLVACVCVSMCDGDACCVNYVFFVFALSLLLLAVLLLVV